MPLATEVRLPRAQLPVFPDQCCACQKPRPGDVLVVSRRLWSWWELLFAWLWFARKPFRCEAPACPPCRLAALRERRWQAFAVVVVVSLAVFVVAPWVQAHGVTRGWRKLVTLGTVLVVSAPIVVWMTCRPLVFDITVGKRHVTYEFRDRRYADLFRSVNTPKDG